MMDRTDRHFRVLVRQLTRRTLLYTEMITTGAILHGDRQRLLGFSAVERPLAVQLGGDDPKALAECARIAEGMGYDEVNLNVGCPSDRAFKGTFGACLMADPHRVALCVEAMRAAVGVPVTVKHRIGIDDSDRYEDMLGFVDVVARSGCDRFTVHARKAVLAGLSPKQNREVPPLRHGDVHRLKRERPHLVVELNGGVGTLEETVEHLRAVDAVMVGRAAVDRPESIALADQVLFGETGAPCSPESLIAALADHAEWWMGRGGRLHDVTRHALTLFSGRPGARSWRRALSEAGAREGAGPEVLERALRRVEVGSWPRAGRGQPQVTAPSGSQ